VRGELVDTLADLVDRLQTGRIERLARVVIETTGLADPVPVLQSIMGHPALIHAFRLDGVITVVDAVNGSATLDAHVEAVKQVAVADRIVLTKADIVDDAEWLDALKARLARINPGAEIREVEGAAVAKLLQCGLYDPATKTADVRRWLGEAQAHDHHHHHGDHGHHHHHSDDHHDHDHGHHHDSRVGSFSLTHAGALPFSTVEMFLDLLLSTQGDKLLRIKGIVELMEDRDRPLVIHGVQKLLHPPARLPSWPDAVRGTRLVLIGIDLPRDYVERLFSAFVNKPAIDTPDREAMENNPLAIAGR
jgi:G3E family GTPase